MYERRAIRPGHHSTGGPADGTARDGEAPCPVGHFCEGGNRESDRGSCSATTLFGDDAYACNQGIGCPYVVAEGHVVEGRRPENRSRPSRGFFIHR